MAALGCAPAESNVPAGDGGRSGSGGATGAGGASGTGGAAGTGGAGTGSGGSQTTGTGGATGTGGVQAGSGGASGSGGAAGRGSGGATGGGSGTGGRAGTGGMQAGSGGAGGGAAATPSAGCGMSGRPSGGVVMSSERIFTFPASYDGMRPMPVLVGFHANGNPITQIRDLTNGTDLETGYVRMFPKSSGAGWVLSTDSPRFTTMFNELLSNYCVDTSRVFATGHSSGAQMIVQLLCASGGERRFKGVAPVAASRYCTRIAVPVAAMYIQGMMDMMRGDSNGKDVVDVFVASNMCTTTSSPRDVAMCNSTFDRQAVTPGCVDYQGCMVPTTWCSHNDNGYNATDGNMHGWPCFASRAMAQFFAGIP
jgi:hypothetical protein